MRDDDYYLYTTTDIQNILGIPRGRFKEWLHDFLIPHTKAQTRGEKNYFSRLGVYQIAVMDHLLRRGFSREEASFHSTHLALSAAGLSLSKKIRSLADNERIPKVYTSLPKYLVFVYTNNEKPKGIAYYQDTELDDFLKKEKKLR